MTGSIVGLMILAEFPADSPFPTNQAKIQRFSNDIDYTEDGNTGSIRRYFRDQSGDLLDLTHIVTERVLLPRPRSFYSTDP